MGTDTFCEEYLLWDMYVHLGFDQHCFVDILQDCYLLRHVFVRSLPAISLHHLSVGYEKLNVHGFKVNDRIVAITTRKDIPVKVVLGVKKILETQAA